MTKDEENNWIENNFVNLNEFLDSYGAIINYITDRLGSALSEDKKYKPINKDDFKKLQINLLIDACKLQFIGSSRFTITMITWRYSSHGKMTMRTYQRGIDPGLCFRIYF